MSTSSTAGEAFVPVAQWADVTLPPLTVRQFLDSIDPDELAEAALGHMGGLGGPTVGETFLMALKKMAEADGA